MDKHGKELKVYYDGTCSVCNSFVKTITSSSKKEAFVSKDVTKGELPRGVSFEKAMRDMYVVESGGRMYEGGEAVLRIMDEYPFLRPLSWIGKLPGVRQCVRVLYRIVATHRYRIPVPK